MAGVSERMKKHVLMLLRTAKKTNELSKEETVRHRQSKEASILWSQHEEISELSGEKKIMQGMQARKATHWTTSRRLSVEESIRMIDDRDK